ncbi:hypothetical protein [Acetivibrio clariflavus]|uniref:hypothetical protein n=1 Tax=Acetivibrio clariflavus TaxID=288965 RepID=UPI0004B87E4C|nr:hypothetical protein [Acetivibrio clariflavus]
MKLVASIFILSSTIHILSFAKYNWSKKNKTAAAGAILLGLLSIILPAIVMLTR